MYMHIFCFIENSWQGDELDSLTVKKEVTARTIEKCLHAIVGMHRWLIVDLYVRVGYVSIKTKSKISDEIKSFTVRIGHQINCKI